MKAFFKTFFASFLALVVFTLLGVFILIGIIAGASSGDKPYVGNKAVLVLDLSGQFKEQVQDNPVNALLNDTEKDQPSLFDMIRMIEYAKSDSSVKGIYILCGTNPNGYASSEELRKALQNFKLSNKFIYAYGETITQKGYYIGSVADKVYCHPQGGLEWDGFSSNLIFLKGLLDKLEIQPQIFYAGKFKSATEPLRETQMTEANRLQTSVWLGDLYNHFLKTVAYSRSLDTATLRQLATTGAIQTADDALKNGLVDGLKYDDEIKKKLTEKLQIGEKTKINFVSFNDYSKAVSYKEQGLGGKLALVFADGDIVSGSGASEQVGSDAFRTLIRKLRMDKEVKAIVFRVNSPGGSSLASDVIWREITLAKKEKPVIVSMGDVAASGGYYIACNADYVFTNENTITGSIGVFSIVPNLSSFYKNKLGITFDGIKTAPYADMGNSSRALNETEKKFFQAGTDSIYHTFKSRVAEGRKKDILYVDSIAQGRVWTGTRSITVGLTDKIGTLQDAIAFAAGKAKLSDYQLKEYPEKKNFLEQIVSGYKKAISTNLIKNEIGVENTRLWNEFKKVKQLMGIPQTRMPFVIEVN